MKSTANPSERIIFCRFLDPVNSMGEGVMVTAPDGVITLVNPAFMRLFSISTDIEEKTLLEISRHPDLQDVFNDLAKSDVDELIREIVILPRDITRITRLFLT